MVRIPLSAIPKSVQPGHIRDRSEKPEWSRIVQWCVYIIVSLVEHVDDSTTRSWRNEKADPFPHSRVSVLRCPQIRTAVNYSVTPGLSQHQTFHLMLFAFALTSNFVYSIIDA
jgi:hypothetical protein